MDPVAEQVLDAAESLFYTKGIQAVGMDEIRSTSGVSLKRLYQLFPAKDVLVEAYLRRRDVRWRRQLATHVNDHDDPDERILAVFDWLQQWFAEPTFRGCAWINSFGELGTTSAIVAREARRHKRAFRDYLTRLICESGRGDDLAEQLYLLAEGAMVSAGIFADPTAGSHARAAAAKLLRP